MDLSYRILGMELETAEKILLAENEHLKINVVFIQGNKDKELLKFPRVVKVSKKEDGSIELTVTFFSNPL